MLKKNIIIQYAALAALGSGLALYGFTWGLPSAERLALVLPPGFDTPDNRRDLSEAWNVMHRDIGKNMMLSPKAWKSFSGVERTPAGWSEPPRILKNSLRSFYIRSAHEDEQTLLIILSRMRPKRLELHPHMFTYGAAHIYALGATLAAGAAVGLVSLHRSLEPYMADPSKMAAMYMAGRFLTAVSYVACALLLLHIGRRRFSAAIGLIAGAIFLLSPGVIIQAHIMKNHIFWTLFALLTLDRCVEVLERGSSKDYALAGAFSGLTVGSFLAAWPATLLVAAAAALRAVKHGRWPRELKGLALAAGCSIGAFLITNPYWVITPGEAMAEMAVLRTTNAGSFNLLNPLIYLWHPVRLSFTLPILVLMLAGGVLALRKGLKDPALLMCLCALAVGLFGTTVAGGAYPTRYIRYILGWTAAGSLLSAYAFLALWNFKTSWRPLARLVLVLVLINLGLEGLSYAHNFHVETTPRSNHVVSGRWIEENVPAGASFGLLRLPQPSNAPFFRYDRYNMVFIESSLFATLPADQLPEYLALTIPDYDDRLDAQPNLSRYERLVSFERERLLPWIDIDATSTTANPLIEIYRLRKAQ